jgi:hypothetical protein
MDDLGIKRNQESKKQGNNNPNHFVLAAAAKGPVGTIGTPKPTTTPHKNSSLAKRSSHQLKIKAANPITKHLTKEANAHWTKLVSKVKK